MATRSPVYGGALASGSNVAATRNGQPGGVGFTPGAYGSVPNATPIPKSLYEETQAADPALTALGAPATGVIGSQLAGQLSPQAMKALQDKAATFGVTSGMPGSGMQANRGLRDLGLSVEQIQQQGLGNYQNALKTLSSMQLEPNLVSGLNTYNNQLSAAPDPSTAAAQTEALWQSHFNQAKDAGILPKGTGGVSYAGGSGGGSGGGSSARGGGGVPAGGGYAGGRTGSTGTSGGRTGSTGTSGGTGYIPDWNSGSTSSDPFTSGNFYDPPITNPSDSYYDGMLDPNSPDYQPGGADAYGSYGNPITDPNDPNYDAMQDPNSPDYQPGGAQDEFTRTWGSRENYLRAFYGLAYDGIAYQP